MKSELNSTRTKLQFNQSKVKTHDRTIKVMSNEIEKFTLKYEKQTEIIKELQNIITVLKKRE